MKCIVRKSKVSGFIVPPPSKSHTLRAILFASLANGRSCISNYLESPDMRHMVQACRQLGASVDVTADEIHIVGVGGKPQIPQDVIQCGNSGQVLRFVGAIAGLMDGYCVFTGDESIRTKRPVKPLLKGLQDLGAFAVSTKGDDKPPIIIKGPMKAGIARINGEDSQPVSGLIIASSFLPDKTEIFVDNPGEKPWIGLTLYWLDRLGIPYQNHQFVHYEIGGGASYKGFDYTVSSDFSSVAYLVAAALVTQSELKIGCVDMNDPQGDKKLLDVLVQMGAQIEYDKERMLLHIKPSTLNGIEVDINDFIDSITILAVIGTFAKGKTVIKNAHIARFKESDRISSICTELKKMGAHICEKEDGLEVYTSSLKGCVLNSYHDHRMVMSLAVAGLGSEGETEIADCAWIEKSYPQFFDHLKKMGADVEVVDEHHPVRI